MGKGNNLTIVTSSPKNDKSFTLRIAKTLAHNIGFENPQIINLNERNIKECANCMKCMITNKCVIQDDIHEIVDILSKSRVIIFSMPVFIFTVNSVMKRLFERMILWTYKVPGMSSKPAMIVCTADGFGCEQTIDYTKKFLAMDGLLFAGSLFCCIHEFKTYKNENSRFNKMLKRAVKRYKFITEKKIYRLGYYDYFYFYMKKSMFIKGKKRFAKEYQYWEANSLFKKDHYDSKEIILKNNFFFKYTAKIAAKFVF